MKLLKNFSIFGIVTLISRFFGFIRDIYISYSMGANYLADAFFIAFRFPNLFRALFADGSLTITFVPMYSRLLQKNPKEASKFADNIFTILLLMVMLVCVICEILMPYIMSLFVETTKDIAYKDMVLCARLMFPYIFFISAISLITGMLQVKKHFFTTAFLPIILNINFIVIGFYILGNIVDNYAIAFSYSVVIAGIIQLIYVIIVGYRYAIDIGFVIPKFTDNTKIFVVKLIPSIIASTIYQLNVLVDTLFASSIPNAVSYLYYSERIVQLPLSIIGVALGSVTLPFLAQYSINDDKKMFFSLQNKSFALSTIFVIPATVAIMMLSNVIISTLFVHKNGLFTEIDAKSTANLMQILVFALPAFVYNKIFTTIYFSIGDTKTPTIFAFISLLLNISLNSILIYPYGAKGIVISTVIASYINLICLTTVLKKRDLCQPDKITYLIIKKVVFSSVIMAFVLLFSSVLLEYFSYQFSYSVRLSILAVIVLFGLVSYFISLYLSSRDILKYFSKEVV